MQIVFKMLVYMWLVSSPWVISPREKMAVTDLHLALAHAFSVHLAKLNHIHFLMLSFYITVILLISFLKRILSFKSVVPKVGNTL